ncbi:MAG: tetratricopeptide repeat-containing sulfotransferase family protein [Pseudomarimonas sp.]
MDRGSNTPAASSAALRQSIGAAFSLLRQAHLDDARRHGDELLAAHPTHAEVLYLASEVRMAQGENAAALSMIVAAIEAAPGQLPLLLKKARIQLALRRRADARQTAELACTLAGQDGQALWAVGRIFGLCNDLDRARALYQSALDAGCSDPSLRYDLAVGQFFAGDFAAAESNIDRMLAVTPLAGHALYRRSTLRRQTPENNHVAELQSKLAAAAANSVTHSSCLFALAKELEDLGRFEESFAALSQAAAIKRKSREYDAAGEREAIDAVRAAYDQSAMNEATVGHPEPGAIFIVGMPRTGSTLVERMLSCHSEVNSAGELLDFGQALAEKVQQRARELPDTPMAEVARLIDFAALGADYMTGARQAAPPSRWVIDKMPINFMYCGLIKKALPNARIIHVHREPMDTCYAIYQTLFNQAYPFSCNLQELADYYATYHRLMQHWHSVMPGEILDVSYEALLSDTESEARRMLDWCGLEWQDAVLDPSASDAPATTASAAQVRQPINSRSVQKWRRYEAELAPLKAALLSAGVLTA